MTGRGAWGLALTILLAACGSPSQLIVVVDTNLSSPGDIDEVEIVVIGPSRLRSGTSQPLSGAELPLTLGVSPAGDSLGPVDVLAIGRLGGVEVVQTSARVTLLEGETLTLTLHLVRGCVGRSCEPGQACAPGGCRTVERGDLPVWSGEAPPFVSSDPCDALEWDADGDGEGSVECGGTDCDDDDNTRNSAAAEVCDGIDNDCDDEVDPGCACSMHGLVEACVTECGSEGNHTCSDGMFGECVLSDETCNGADDDCDGRVDEGFEYTAVGESLVSGEAEMNLARQPRIVGADGRWAIVWSETSGIMLAVRNADGSAYTAPAIVNSDGNRPDLAWSGGTLGLVHHRAVTVDCGADCTRTDHHLVASALSLAGEFRSADEMVLATNTNAMPDLRVRWDGTAFRAVYRAEATITARSFDETGAPVAGGLSFSVENTQSVDFTHGDARYAVAYERSNDVYFLSTTGLGMETPHLVHSATFVVRGVALDWTGMGYLVGWGERALTSDTAAELRVVLVDDAGEILSGPTSLSSGMGSLFGNEPEPSIRGGGGQVLVTWTAGEGSDTELYFARFDPSGAMIQGPTRLTNAEGTSEGPSLAYTEGRFAVAWTDEREGMPQTYFAELGCSPTDD